VVLRERDEVEFNRRIIGHRRLKDKRLRPAGATNPARGQSAARARLMVMRRGVILPLPQIRI
jgi:hypothetical protein